MEPLTPHTLRLGSYGKAVEASKRAVYRFLDNGFKWTGFVNQTTVERRTFGPFFRRDVLLVQGVLSVDQTGRIDKVTLASLEAAGSFDQKARALWLQQFPVKPEPPPLIQPIQGFDSLVKDLWDAYALGRGMGLSDLGTYNPDSKLPSSGSPSDHATSRKDGRIAEPACAFDLGFTPAVGMSNPVANKFFHLMIGRPEVAYVICGTSIWSEEKGLHAYTSGGHEGHVHTSGHRR